jgi:hypothetical protein
MNKIYLKLKRDISILVADGYWSLNNGDMIVLQKVGTKSEIKRNEYKANEYIHSDSYLLTGFEYKTIKDIISMEYHTVWNECNSVDTLITISTGKPLYHSRTCTYSEIISNNKLNITIVDNIRHDDVFEDVSITYNRDNKLKEILNYE